ncbi:hypothetical protein ALC57_05778 [Trachymyrmex cornetzi]|uniref:Uncharacterized protein n=1 Tax=Trachymyrmex cornetzi TaxID=471704 RepID=A0A151J9X2_9HYME|nr:hypothetical protein ALC57_05778 [Trachymyrmex cornetzi]
MKWQSTPQLSWQREFRRRQLLKAFGIYKMLKRIENLKIQRQFWVRPIFTEERRHLQRASDNLIREMQYIDMEKYIEYLRMDTLIFHELLHLIGPKIEKQHVVRSPISVSTRPEICLRYLASGDNMSSISFAFSKQCTDVSTPIGSLSIKNQNNIIDIIILNLVSLAIWDIVHLMLG